jgi:membrane protein implicated in regulation of membrane protease activity
MRDWIIWLVAGLALLGIEIHAPGAFMMWLASPPVAPVWSLWQPASASSFRL